MGVIQVAKFENTHQLEQESHPILQLATASEADNVENHVGVFFLSNPADHAS
jgi:hypothetical protein